MSCNKCATTSPREPWNFHDLTLRRLAPTCTAIREALKVSARIDQVSTSLWFWTFLWIQIVLHSIPMFRPSGNDRSRISPVKFVDSIWQIKINGKSSRRRYERFKYDGFDRNRNVSLFTSWEFNLQEPTKSQIQHTFTSNQLSAVTISMTPQLWKTLRTRRLKWLPAHIPPVQIFLRHRFRVSAKVHRCRRPLKSSNSHAPAHRSACSVRLDANQSKLKTWKRHGRRSKSQV